MRRTAAAVALAALALAGCSSGATHRVSSGAGGTTTTTAAAVSGAEAGGGTTTSAPPASVAPTTAPAGPTTSTTAGKQATRVASAADPSTTVPATTTTAAAVTTTNQPGATTTSSTMAAPSTTTTTLETVPALMIGTGQRNEVTCPYFNKAIPEGLDFDKLSADLAAKGYRLGAVKFRDRTGQAIADPTERNTADTRQQWQNCFHANGDKAIKPTLTTTAGNAGSRSFADLVVGQLDAVFQGSGYQAFYSGVTIA